MIHQIPVGPVSTYGTIAKMAGYPGYARHVGKALGHLPEESVTLFSSHQQPRQNFTGREDFVRQRKLLLAEGIEVSDTGKISLRKYQWQP